MFTLRSKFSLLGRAFVVAGFTVRSKHLSASVVGCSGNSSNESQTPMFIAFGTHLRDRRW